MRFESFFSYQIFVKVVLGKKQLTIIKNVRNTNTFSHQDKTLLSGSLI